MAEPSREDVARYEETRRRLAIVEERVAALGGALGEMQRAAATLDGLGSGEAYVPIGAGVYVRAQVDTAAPVLHPLGADYATASDAAVVREGLASRAEETARRLQEAQAEGARLEAALHVIEDKLQAGMV